MNHTYLAIYSIARQREVGKPRRGFLRDIAANEAAPAPVQIGVVAENIAPIEAGNEWLMIAPYGDHPHSAGLQKFHRANAEKMVAEFNSVAGRMARLFRGLPVYAGHPDVDPENYPDDRRLGKVTALEAREDGLYGKVSWNKLGQENLEEGYRPYPSPAWRAPKRNDGSLDPQELISIGLTNTPNILGSRPWTNSESQTQQPATEPPANNTMPPWLIELLGLSADATEEQVKSALTAKLSAANNMDEEKQREMEQAMNTATARITELEGQLTAANTANTAALELLRNTLLDAAINDGRITAADRPAHETAFKTDFTVAANALKALKPKLNTQGIEIAGTRVAINTAQERQRIISDAVAEHQAKHQCSYEVAYNAVKKDAKYKAVFDAMNKPKHQQEAAK